MLLRGGIGGGIDVPVHALVALIPLVASLTLRHHLHLVIGRKPRLGVRAFFFTLLLLGVSPIAAVAVLLLHCLLLMFCILGPVLASAVVFPYLHLCARAVVLLILLIAGLICSPVRELVVYHRSSVRLVVSAIRLLLIPLLV